jgi:hypothetical protein
MPIERPSTGGRFALEVMGANAGFMKRFDGLQMEADVVTNDLGPENIQKKHVANIRWTPGKATIGIGMAKEMSTLIQRAFAAQQRFFDHQRLQAHRLRDRASSVTSTRRNTARRRAPDIYFYPRYVGAGGWVGILLDQIADDALESHLREARRIIASRRKPARKPRGM